MLKPFFKKINYLFLLSKSILNIYFFKSSYWIFNKFKRTPKNCVLCESWVWFKAPLCRPCRKYLYQEYLKTEYDILNISDRPCYYLWKWTVKNEFFIQKLIVSMKDGDNLELYKVFMPWLAKKLLTYKNLTLITAIPSIDRDHPLALIETYQNLNPNLKNLELLKVSTQSQKYKSKTERLNTSFIFKDSKNEIVKKGKILVLDDVVSTGGSFKGVLKLLKDHEVQALAVWTYRC